MVDTNIWLILGPILAALFGAVVGGFLREWWVERFYRPTLYIVGERVISGEIVTHYRIIVKNNGKRSAENCIGKITLDALAEDVRNVGRSSILGSDYFTTIEGMSLCWSRLGNLEVRTINRGAEELLELCMVYLQSGKEVPRLEIPSEEGWKRIRVALRIDKEYHGKIEVTSANADPTWASFKLVPQEDDVRLVITDRKPS